VSGSGIQLDHVDKSFADRRGAQPICALANVSLDIAPHTFVSFVGPSGCGKSTLLRIIGGLTLPTSGRVNVGDRHMTGPRRDVGLMFQTPVLFPWRTVLENVLLPMEVFGADRSRYTEKARAMLCVVGLGERLQAYPNELSGGMQQRVALSRVLAIEPSIILMDEPFGALDEFTREKLNLELLRLWQERQQTVVLVTHSISEAVFLSDEVMVMGTQPGRILASIKIPLPRPRTTVLMKAPEFSALTFAIREQLGLD
jgi:NitT/TauT family transport system ATP-binding protein